MTYSHSYHSPAFTTVKSSDYARENPENKYMLIIQDFAKGLSQRDIAANHDVTYVFVRSVLTGHYKTKHLKKLQVEMCGSPERNRPSVFRSKNFLILSYLIKRQKDPETGIYNLRSARIAEICKVSRQRVEQVESLAREFGIDFDKITYNA